MSWQSYISALIARYGNGNVAQKVTCLVAKTLVPGIVVDLLESAFEVAKTVAKDHQEAELLAKTRANVQDLERLGELLGHLTGDMAKVCSKAEAFIEEDMPEKVEGAVLRAIQNDPVLMATQRKMEQVCRQMSRIEEQNSELIEGMEEMRPLVGRIRGVADYAEDMRQAGVNGRHFVEMMQEVQSIKQLLIRGQTDQTMAKLRELPPEVRAMPSVMTLEAGARFVARESVAAATLLQKASHLKPNDTELGDLSRTATQISGLNKDTKPDFPSLIPLKRFNISDVIGGFTLTARLGSGGWGQVFRATRDGQTKALKIMHPELSQNNGVVDRFTDEIMILTRLPKHPNLVRIDKFGYCTNQKCWYLVMDYIDGPTLDGYLKTNGAMSAGLVKSLFQPVAEALGAAHAIGIVHRDIKPGNMVFRNADNRLVLIDFGLANDSNDSGKAQVDGKTIFFAAPEQLRGRSADSRSDVFSLAATMHFALEYADRDRREPDHFTAANAPAELRDAMVRSMASWGERFAHAGELAAAMEKANQEMLEEQRRAQEKAEAERQVAIVEEQHRAKVKAEAERQAAIVEEQRRAKEKVEAERQAAIDAKQRRTEEKAEAERQAAIDAKQRRTEARTFDLGNSVKLEMVLIPAGKFIMGSPNSEKGRVSNETQHEVKISEPFYFGKYPITQDQWQQVMGNNPSHFKGDGLLPVENISWDQIQIFCDKIKEITGLRFGIPTEAQWEYACRSGTTTPFYFGRELNGIQANCKGINPYGTKILGPHIEKTSPVGQYLANPWDLHDMHGNVWEWCSDWYEYYPKGSVIDQSGPIFGSNRVIRGGSWADDAAMCRSAYRYWENPSNRSNWIGLRLTMNFSEIANYKVLTQYKPQKIEKDFYLANDSLFDSGDLLEAEPQLIKIEEQRRPKGKAKIELQAHQSAVAMALAKQGVQNKPVQDFEEGFPKNRTFDLGNGINLEMVLIPAGTFMMGSHKSEAKRRSDETLHQVTISKPFYMGKYPVTQAQWQQVMGTNPSELNSKGLRPVENVSWDDTQAFCLRLKEITQAPFVIPSEALWEYACRAGTTTPFQFGGELNGSQANCNGNNPYPKTEGWFGTAKSKGPFLGKSSPVGNYPANAWGLHDMHGNVWEWCSDWYGEYPTASATDPSGPATGSMRVFRGGSWGEDAEYCRSANRGWGVPSVRDDDLGFRVAFSLSEIPK